MSRHLELLLTRTQCGFCAFRSPTPALCIAILPTTSLPPLILTPFPVMFSLASPKSKLVLV